MIFNSKVIMTKIFKTTVFAVMMLAGMVVSSCSKTQSYSELRRDEEHAVNWFLAQKRVELQVPSDSISFETGENAPFYKLDEDGYVYMQVINKGEVDDNGTPTDKVKSGDQVYFRFERKNIKYMYENLGDAEGGNSDNLTSEAGTYFFYKNTYMQVSTQWGTGIQMPMKFFGYNCEVNLIIKSYCGFVSDQTNCDPYVLNVRYFKPEY